MAGWSRQVNGVTTAFPPCVTLRFFDLSTHGRHPLYRIEKRPKLRNRQGEYAVLGADGQALKRGHDLRGVLRVLERKLIAP